MFPQCSINNEWELPVQGFVPLHHSYLVSALPLLTHTALHTDSPLAWLISAYLNSSHSFKLHLDPVVFEQPQILSPPWRWNLSLYTIHPGWCFVHWYSVDKLPFFVSPRKGPHSYTAPNTLQIAGATWFFKMRAWHMEILSGTRYSERDVFTSATPWWKFP